MSPKDAQTISELVAAEFDAALAKLEAQGGSRMTPETMQAFIEKMLTGVRGYTERSMAPWVARVAELERKVAEMEAKP